MPTFLELQGSLNVSKVTLDTALRELENQDIVVRRHAVGIFVSERVRKTVSLLCNPSFFRSVHHSPFWDVLVEQARARAAELEENLRLDFALSSLGAEDKLQVALLEDIRQGRVQGIIGIGLEPRAYGALEEAGVPLVAFAGAGARQVAVDDTQIYHLGVEALAARGCRRIGLWRPVPGFRRISLNGETAFLKPRRCFEAAVREAGLEFDPRLLQDNHELLTEDPGEVTISSQEQGFETARRVFGGKTLPRPDGLIIADDVMTHGALVALDNLGLRAGRDLEIASHTNRGSQLFLGREGLILLETDPGEMVHELFNMLGQLMRGETPPQPIVYVGFQLRVNAS
jgi:DNA-binding LacI/PurR family transcriptional regulator